MIHALLTLLLFALTAIANVNASDNDNDNANANSTSVIFGYLPTWQLAAVDSIDLARYTHLTIAFAIPDENGQITMDNRDSILTTYAHSPSQKILVSLGGWTGSKHFSAILKSPEKRQTMMSEMVQWIKDFGFDGWDIDFEYPGRQGDSCHAFDAQSDTKNLLSFVTELNALLKSEFPGSPKLITMATRFQPFDGPQGPLSDVSEFSSQVDFINIMLYDFNGVWSDTTGPNAPLDFVPGKGLQFSFRSSIQAWIDAGIPASKINAGLALYGRTVAATSDNIPAAATREMYYSLDKQIQIPRGDSDDVEEVDPSCGGPKVYSGIWKYRNMRSEGILDTQDTAAEPWVRHFDPDTFTPWLFNPENKNFISYDDPISLAAKTQHAKDMRLAGVMVWPVTNDYDNELINAISSVIN
ncbi:hypothetical protein GGI07_002998 [Coemansia sp. Benny D115]|nr:hypothetical protein GGI07_002998 [Coemansia sp. Benny D115]